MSRENTQDKFQSGYAITHTPKLPHQWSSNAIEKVTPDTSLCLDGINSNYRLTRRMRENWRRNRIQTSFVLLLRSSLAMRRVKRLRRVRRVRPSIDDVFHDRHPMLQLLDLSMQFRIVELQLLNPLFRGGDDETFGRLCTS